MQIKGEFLGKSVAWWKKETAFLEKRNMQPWRMCGELGGEGVKGTEEKRIDTPQNHILKARKKSAWHKL